MERLVRPYLDDILEAITGIEPIVANKSFDDYANDWMLRRAVERGVEIISEASRRIPEPLRQTQPAIPWKEIMGVGNVLRYDYRDVSDKVIFEVATRRLASLKAAVLAIEASLDEPED